MVPEAKVPGTKNGAEYRIQSIVDEKHIEIATSSDKSMVINFYEYSQQCQLYKEVQKGFAPGETIIFTKNTSIEDGVKVKNGERAVIESIEDGIIQTVEGKRIDIKEMGFIDYGYAITDYKSQGATTKNVTILADTQIASLNAFYTQVTRAKENITIYTDNIEALLANLKKDARQRSTLEYTIDGEKIKAQLEVRKEINQTVRGAGTTLLGVDLKLNKSTALLSLPVSHRSSSSLHTLTEKLDTVIQTLDTVLSQVQVCTNLGSQEIKSVMNESPNQKLNPSICKAPTK